MEDFWERYGESYQIFSQYCSYYDWQNILETIANEIAQAQKEQSYSILDIGPGKGRNILEILEILFTKLRKRNILDIVEPSNIGVNILESLIVSVENGGYLRNIYRDTSNIQDSKYNIILFMHSSYYINNFCELIFKLLSENLFNDGKLLILTLPYESPFFLGKSELYLPNTTEEIIGILEEKKIKYEVHRLESKFFLNKNFDISKSAMEKICFFMTREKISFNDFIILLKKHYKKGVLDFSDDLIVIKKK